MLQIVVDKSIEDKYRDKFVSAIIGTCLREGIFYGVVTSEKSFCINEPYVITEPCTFMDRLVLHDVLDCDRYATANVIMDILDIKEVKDILVIGRGKLIGKPVVDMIIKNTNHQVSIVNSHVGHWKLKEKISACDVIVNGSTSPIRYSGKNICSKIIVDPGNTFNSLYLPCHQYFMKEIGKATVDKIAENYKKIKHFDCGEIEGID